MTEDRSASVWAQSNPDIGMHQNEIRQTCQRVGTVSQQLYTGSGIAPPSGISYPVRSSQKKPANYDGTSSFQDYLVQFEMTGDLNKWDEGMKAMELATSLRGTAQTVLSDLRPEQRRDYNQLVSALTARFEPTNQTELYRAQIKSRLRKKAESVQELATDIKRLVRRAYPQATSELRDQIARDCFIDSLNEHELEWFVYQGKPKTVDEAMQLALEYEAFQAGRKRSVNVRQCTKGNNPNPDSDLTKLSNRLGKLESKLESLIGQQNNNVTCHNCHGKGHKYRNCPGLRGPANHPFNRYHNYPQRGNNNANSRSYNNQQPGNRQGNFQ